MLINIFKNAILAGAVLAWSQMSSFAQGALETRGEALVTQHCAMCHASGNESSPNPLARPFRTLGQFYAIESLEEPLRNGALLGHPMMPRFALSASDAHAIVRYLQSIQAHPR